MKVDKRWVVYTLECCDGSFYTGVTNDVEKRMEAHVNGKGSKYVYAKKFKKLLRVKECDNKSDAHKCEYKIKQLPKWQKLEWYCS